MKRKAVPCFLAQRQQQFDDRGLHGDVQRRGDLVADHEFRPRGEGPCDGDALLFAARKLMRPAVGVGCGQAHLVEQAGNIPKSAADRA